MIDYNSSIVLNQIYSLDIIQAPLTIEEYKFCSNHGLNCYFLKNELHIHSFPDFWIIAVNEQTGQLSLFHRNRKMGGLILKNRCQFPHYHVQKVFVENRFQILNYIVNHDAYLAKCEAKVK